MEKKFDIEAQLFMYLLRLKEQKNKEYTNDLSDINIAYRFENYEEFKNYFINNGCPYAYIDEYISICKMKTTKKGTIIALKCLCDYAIKKSIESNSKNKICDTSKEKNKSMMLVRDINKDKK